MCRDWKSFSAWFPRLCLEPCVFVWGQQVGPATSTAVLCVADPSIPFMSDEAMVGGAFVLSNKRFQLLPSSPGGVCPRVDVTPRN